MKNDKNELPSFDSSPFVRRIRERLASLALEDARLRVSVADESVWEASDVGDEVLVRWACWSIEDDGGVEVAKPEFEVLSDKVTRQQLAAELPIFFPDITVVVDNDIDPPDP